MTLHAARGPQHNEASTMFLVEEKLSSICQADEVVLLLLEALRFHVCVFLFAG